MQTLLSFLFLLFTSAQHRHLYFGCVCSIVFSKGLGKTYLVGVTKGVTPGEYVQCAVEIRAAETRQLWRDLPHDPPELPGCTNTDKKKVNNRDDSLGEHANIVIMQVIFLGLIR